MTSIREFFQQDKFAMLGAIIYLVFILVAVFAPLLAPYDPQEMVRVDGRIAFNREPDSQFKLGTTNMGRDIFSQLIHGVRPALTVGFTAALFVMVVGTVVGLVAGYFGGKVDSLLMRLTDVAFGIPFDPFVIVLVSFLGPSIWNIVLAMALLLWRDTARVIRSQVLSIKKRAFVEAGRVSGASHARIIFSYIMPNILPLSLLYGSLAIGWAILTEAAVSFLGFGDPKSISWGYMLHDAYVSQALSRGAFYWMIPPGVCIMLLVMAGFYISRGAEEVLQPKLRSM